MENKVKEQQDEANKLANENKILKQEINTNKEEYQTTSREKDGKIANYENNKQIIEQSMQNMQLKIQGYEQTISHIKKDNETDENYNKIVNENKAYQQQIEMLTQTNEEMAKKCQECNNLKKSIETLKNENNNYIDINNKLKEQKIKENTSNIQKHQYEQNSIKDSVNITSNKVPQANEENAKKELDDIFMQFQTTSIDLENQKAQMLEYMKEHQPLKDRAANIEASLSKAKSDISVKDTAISQLTTQLAEEKERERKISMKLAETMLQLHTKNDAPKKR